MSRKYNLLVKEYHAMVIFGMGVSKMPFLYQGHENVIFGTVTYFGVAISMVNAESFWSFNGENTCFLLYFGVEWIKLLLQGSSFGHFWNGVQVLDIFK